MTDDNLVEAERRIEEARRSGARALDLGDLGLSQLPESLGCLEDLEVLCLGQKALRADGSIEWSSDRPEASISDLSQLAGLQGLQNLYLSGCKSVSDLSPLAGLLGLQNLDLRWCKSVSDLWPLTGLQGLQNLDLSMCRSARDLSPLAGLQGLRTLDLTGCDSVSDLSPLAGLQGLQNLDLSFSGSVSDLSPLAGLQGLHYLRLRACRSVSDLSPLAGLQGLQNLDLSFCESVSDLSPLAGLQGLQYLRFGSTSAIDLSPLVGLQGLQSLSFSLTFVHDLCPLAGLQGLQSLSSSFTSVYDLSALAGLRGLQNLDLSQCRSVRDLSPLAGLQELQNLDLSKCKSVSDLSPLLALSNLRQLELLDCPGVSERFLRRLLASAPLLSTLKANSSAGLPEEILSQSSDDNCLPRLRTYFAELDQSAEPETDIKVILLGNGKVGKTQLCRRLRDEPFDEAIPSTHGVQLWRQPLTLRVDGKAVTFHANWWDFGGQDIYHGTHALFLRSRAVFLILWHPDLENRDESEENGIPLRNQPLAYWLDYVRSLAGPASPVIVVQSQCESFAQEREPPTSPSDFEFHRSCHFAAANDQGRDELEVCLHQAIRFLQERTGPLQIGKGRAELRRRLYEMREADQRREVAERQHQTLTLQQFRSLCDEVGGILSPEHALDYFHQTGVVFYRKNLFSERIVLDQSWALDAIYTIFHRENALPFLRDLGPFTRKHLERLAWQGRPEAEQRLLLGMMESCGICFVYRRARKDEHTYLAPDLLPPFELVAKRPWSLSWTSDPQPPTLRLEYRFLHQTLLRGLMSRIGRDAGDLAEYWKYGFWLYDARTQSQLLVRQEDTSTEEQPGAGAVVAQAQGREPEVLLRRVRELIHELRIGEKPRELLTLDGETISLDALEMKAEGRVRTAHGRWVDARAFERLLRDGEALEMDDLPEPARTGIQAAPMPKSTEVYLSYAWGDDESDEGRLRTEAVDRLYAALAKDGFTPRRDRDDLQPGQLISGFMNRLSQGNYVVAILSDKYLRSPSCMYELYRIWQRHQGDADQLLQHLVPVVLPGVRIATAVQRSVYSDHWEQVNQQNQALLARKGSKLGERDFAELRLVEKFTQDISDILAFVNDVLMPRDVKAHFANDFEVVLEVLRRRVGARQDR